MTQWVTDVILISGSYLSDHPADVSQQLWSIADAVALTDAAAEPAKTRGPYKPRAAKMA